MSLTRILHFEILFQLLQLLKTLLKPPWNIEIVGMDWKHCLNCQRNVPGRALGEGRYPDSTGWISDNSPATQNYRFLRRIVTFTNEPKAKRLACEKGRRARLYWKPWYETRLTVLRDWFYIGTEDLTRGWFGFVRACYPAGNGSNNLQTNNAWRRTWKVSPQAPYTLRQSIEENVGTRPDPDEGNKGRNGKEIMKITYY